MKSMRLSDSAQSPALVEENVPQPEPQRGELLIRVYAAGVTPTEVLWYPTTHKKDGTARSGAVPGHEFSGVIAAVGEDTFGFEIGEEVYGMNDWFSEGALAEYCITQPSSIARKPRRLTHVEAASVPIGALTAWQGLFDRARLQSDEHVLVHGGGGAVGIFAIQLARFRGAHVTATASPRNLEFISRLGAEQVIDYRAMRFEETVSGIDVVLDTVGGETLERSWSVLKPGGRMITIAANGETTDDNRVKQAFFIVEPNHDQLTRIGDLLDAGVLHPVVDAVLPLALASSAYKGEVKQRLGRGKIVVSVAPVT
ncbi:MAG TPA: NADP-dependent oxidoreductase [Candidatus Binatia bacterium]|jgi:NADPH:quinone reductase-like Zn-dependent oxidoreductase